MVGSAQWIARGSGSLRDAGIEEHAERGRGRITRLVTGLLPAALLGFVCQGPPPRPPLPAPVPGLRQAYRVGLVPVPGGVWNAATGNLLVTRTDLVLDTHVGPVAVGASWNSADAGWLWSFDVRYDGATFVDETGAVHDLSGLGEGVSVSGTRWVKVDDNSVRTQGGLAYDFDASGRLTRVYWLYRNGGPDHQTVVRYESGIVAGRVVVTGLAQCDREQLEACTPLYRIERDPAQGRVRAIVDRAGRRAEYGYDEQGRLAFARDGLDVERGWPGQRYEYRSDGSDLLSALTSSEGERAVYEYASDPAPPLLDSVTLVGEESPRWSFSYGNKGAEGSPYQSVFLHTAGDDRIYSWNERGEITEVAVKVGSAVEVTRYDWQGGRPVRAIGADGLSTQWLWIDDRLARVTLPGGRVVELLYDTTALNQAAPDEPALLRRWDGAGVLEECEYNAFGQIVRRTDEEGDSERLDWVDWLGASHEHVQQYLDRAGRRVLMRLYKEHGHPEFVFVDWPGASLLAEPQPGEENVAYDTVGNLVRPRASEDRGGMLRRAYDADRNVAKLWLAGLESRADAPPSVGPEQEIEIDWRSDGRPLAIRRPHGGDTRFEYDGVGRLRRSLEKVSLGELPDGRWQETRFETDGLGRPTVVERANGMRRELGYDAAGRLVRRTEGRGGEVEAAASWLYEAGRLVRIADSAAGGDEVYTYDGAGRVQRIVYPGGESVLQEYDGRDRVARRSLLRPDGSLLEVVETRLAADEAPRRIAVGGVELYRREPTAVEGQWLETYANGFEVWNLPSSVIQVPDSVVGARGVWPEPEWRRFEITRWLRLDDYETLFDSWACEICYNEGAIFETTGPTRRVYEAGTTYDLAPMPQDPGLEVPGLRLARSFPSLGASQSLPQPPSAYYGYDALSNLTAVERGDGSATAFVYNAERNRLLAIREVTSGETRVAYEYDEAGFVVSRGGVPISWTAGGHVASLGGEQSYAWDLRGHLLSTAGASTYRRRFGGLVEGDASAEFARLVLGPIQLDLVSGRPLYLFHDARGNPLFAVDDEGDLAATAYYTGYGRESVTGSALAPRSFALGRSAGELVILGARLYDPLAARFLSPDPITQVVNQYVYTQGNPIQFWDPGGLHGTALGTRLQATGAALVVAGAAAALVPATAAASPPLIATGGIFSAAGTLVNFFGAPEAGGAGPVEGTAPAPPETPAPTAAPGVSGAGGGAATPTGPQMDSCSPDRLAEVPRLEWLAVGLLPLQGVLAWLLLRGRREGGS